MSIEWLMGFGFILICFVAVLVFQIYIFYRNLATYDLLRIVRLESIEGESLFFEGDATKMSRSDFEKELFGRFKNEKIAYFGSLFEYVFKDEGMEIERLGEYDPPFQNFKFSMKVDVLPFLKIEDQFFVYKEPKMPAIRDECPGCESGTCLISGSSESNIGGCSYPDVTCNCDDNP